MYEGDVSDWAGSAGFSQSSAALSMPPTAIGQDWSCEISGFSTRAAAMSDCKACVQPSVPAGSTPERLPQRRAGNLRGIVIWQQTHKAVVSSTHVDSYSPSFCFIFKVPHANTSVSCPNTGQHVVERSPDIQTANRLSPFFPAEFLHIICWWTEDR